MLRPINLTAIGIPVFLAALSPATPYPSTLRGRTKGNRTETLKSSNEYIAPSKELPMTSLHFVTNIRAPRGRVFDFSRDMDLHARSAAATLEQIVGGRHSGLLELGETVRFRGRHFGVWLTHTSVMKCLSPYDYFVDEMTKGHFRYFRHEHRFTEEGGQTRMEDIVNYEVPFGWCGRQFDRLFLQRHLTAFLTERNQYLKEVAEQEVGYPPENWDRLGP